MEISCAPYIELCYLLELSYLPRIVSDEFEVARLQYVLAGLLFKTLAFPTQSGA